MGDHGEIMGKSWENHGKIMGNDGKIMVVGKKNDFYMADTFNETGCMKSGIPLRTTHT